MIKILKKGQQSRLLTYSILTPRESEGGREREREREREGEGERERGRERV